MHVHLPIVPCKKRHMFMSLQRAAHADMVDPQGKCTVTYALLMLDNFSPSGPKALSQSPATSWAIAPLTVVASFARPRTFDAGKWRPIMSGRTSSRYSCTALLFSTPRPPTPNWQLSRTGITHTSMSHTPATRTHAWGRCLRARLSMRAFACL